MKPKIGVTNDILFQQIFSKVGNEKITKSLLEKILKIEIEEITLDVNKQQLGELVDDKVSILDVKAKINGGTKALIEMQIVKYPNMEQRLLYYWSRAYIGDLKRGEDYINLDKTIAILITADNLDELEGIENCHTKWQIREEKTNRLLTGDLELHIIELKKYNEENQSEEGDWIKFIKEGTNMEKREGLDEGIQAAMEELDRLLADEELVRAYEAREKYLRDKISYERWMKERREEMDRKEEEIDRRRGEMDRKEEEIGKRKEEVERDKKEVEKDKEEVEKDKEEVKKAREEIEQKLKKEAERGEKKGIEQGKIEGKVEGIQTEQREIVLKLKTKKYTIEQIADMLDLTEERVKQIIETAKEQ